MENNRLQPVLMFHVKHKVLQPEENSWADYPWRALPAAYPVLHFAV